MKIYWNYFYFSVVPQPVYMNMGELAALAAQKALLAGQQNDDYSPTNDDSPDLKTPTAEDIISVPEQKVKSHSVFVVVIDSAKFCFHFKTIWLFCW